MADPVPRGSRPGLVFLDFVTHWGGAQRSTAEMLQALLQDCNVRVVDAYGVCREWLAALDQAEVPVQVLLPRSRRPFIGGAGRPLGRLVRVLAQAPDWLDLRRALRRTLDRVRPDLVLTNSTKGLALLWLAGAFSGHQIVFYARGWYRRDQVPALGRCLIRRAHRVLAVSTATASALREWGVVQDRIYVVHTRIDPERVHRDARREVTDRPPHADRPVRILLPAQILRTKGQAVAVEAAAILRDRGLDFVLWLAGDVKMGSDGRYRKEVAHEIARRGLQDHVFLLGLRSDAAALMRCAEIVILPTHSEGFPRAVWEAQVLARPVVSTPMGGVTDLIEDGRTGLLVPMDDGPALAGAITRLCEDPALRARIVKNAADQIGLRFSEAAQHETLCSALGSTRQEVFHASR